MLSASLAALGWLHPGRPAPICMRTAGAPRMELGLQVDPLATAGSLFVLSGFTALQLKVRGAIERREARDAARESLRKAEVLLLAGKLTPDDVERAAANAKNAVDEYEEARRIIALGGVLLRVPDPSASPEPSSPEPAPEGEPASRPGPSDPLDAVRDAMGLKNPDAPSKAPGSLLPTGSSSVTIKDVAILFVLVLQVAWFALSLTDPMGPAGPMLNAALTSGGEYVDQREARRAAESAEYRAMLQAAVDSGEAPPTCATRKLGEGLGGCASEQASGLELSNVETAASASSEAAQSADAEFARTRGLNANREWISGPPNAAAF